MKIKVIIFGQLCDLLGESLILQDVADTSSLTEVLKKKFPGLANAKYVMAVDKKVVTENIILNNNSTVALLPPFSGG